MRKQCRKCPWRKDTNPHDIPNGYCPAKHAALKSTIANSPTAFLNHKAMRMMACHETPVNQEQPCIGWLHNQLGRGNNIALRLHVMNHRDLGDFELDGEQHDSFEDTLPK